MSDYVFIKDLISEKISGEWGVDPTTDHNIGVIRTTNFTNEGKLNLEKLALRDISESKIISKKLVLGDVIIEKSGGSPSQPVGRVVYFDVNDGKDYLCNNFTSILRPTKDIFPKYLFYGLYFLHLSKKTLAYQNKTTGIINLQLDRYLTNERLQIHSIDEQRRIVEMLDGADLLRQKRMQAISLLDQYQRTTFLEIFGDPVLNPRNWETKTLGEIADIKSGVTKGRKFGGKDTVFVPYMRVANVQDENIDLREIKTIEVLPSDIEKYKLLNGDLLLTEGGDPDKLGRGGIWRGEIENCIHQNHIFRIRLDSQVAIPEYLSTQIGSYRGKKYFLKSAKQTTGIATINITQLKNYPALIPPLNLQIKYGKICNEVEDLKKTMTVQLKELDNQFSSLIQKAFN